jgi:membrane-bound ClpP family serine protease
MRIGTALVLIAIGAILRFAVNVSADGFNIHTIGVILMVVGAIGLVITLIMAGTVDRRADRPVVRERDVY